MRNFKTHEYRLFPNKEQKKLIEKKLNNADILFDELADMSCWLFQEKGSSLREVFAAIESYEITHDLEPVEMRCIKKQIKTLVKKLADGEIKSIFHRNHYRSRRSVEICFPAIQNETADIDGIGAVPISYHRSLPDNAMVFRVSLKADCAGAEYYLVYGFYYECSDTMPVEVDADNVIGIDYVQNGLYVDSNGVRGDYPGYKKIGRSQLIRYRDAVNRFTVGSSRWIKYQQRLKRYSVAQPLERGYKYYYSIIQGCTA